MFLTDSSTQNYFKSEKYKTDSGVLNNISSEIPFLKLNTISGIHHKIIKSAKNKSVKACNHPQLANTSINYITNTSNCANSNILYNTDNNNTIEDQTHDKSIYPKYKDDMQLKKKISSFNNNKNINKRYKNIQEISEDKDFFRLLYLSNNLNESKKKETITQKNNQNTIHTTNDNRNIVKYTALFFKKIEKAIFLFNSSMYEKAYKSLKDDKIVCNITEFILFLILIPGIDNEIFYKYLSLPINSNQNFLACKIFFNYLNFSEQTVLNSTLFLLKILKIKYIISNNDVTNFFVDAYIRDNIKLLNKNPNLKNDVKLIMDLIFNLNYIISVSNNKQEKSREYFIGNNITSLNWNSNNIELICNDINIIPKLKTVQNILGYIYDEYIKHQNILEREKNEIKMDIFDSYSTDYNQIKRKGTTNYSLLPKDNISNLNMEMQHGQCFSDDIYNIIGIMKLGGFFQKVYNKKGETLKCFLTLSESEKYINIKLFNCCWNNDKINLSDINSCVIGHSGNFYTTENAEYFFTIILNSNKYYQFYCKNEEYNKNWVNGIRFLIKFRKAELPALSQLKVKKEKISVIWQNEILPNWNKYRKYILIKKKYNNDKNNKLNNLTEVDDLINTLQNNNEEILTLWKWGLPSWLRQNMWKIIIGNKLLITENLFQGYMKIIPMEYKNYMKENNKMIISFNETGGYKLNVLKEIIFDIHKYYNRHSEIILNMKKNKFQKEVYDIIRCFCLFRPDVLYTKEIIELSSLFYLNTDNYFDAFKLLSNFVIPSYLFNFIQKDIVYINNFVDFFESLIKKYLLMLYKYFEKMNFKNNNYFYKWAKYLYLKNLDYNLCLRIFDNYLIKGKIFVFQVALAILFIKQEELLNSNYSNLVLILKKKQIDINEDSLFEQIEKIDIRDEYREYFDMYTLGKEKLELMQDL